MLYTVNSLNGAQVSQIAERLDLDLAYTSRILGTLEDEQLLQRTISSQDRRQREVALTPEIAALPDFEGAFDADRLTADGCEVLFATDSAEIEFWFNT